MIRVSSRFTVKWLPCEKPGVIGLELRLAVTVAVFCDWLRQRVYLQLLS